MCGDATLAADDTPEDRCGTATDEKALPDEVIVGPWVSCAARRPSEPQLNSALDLYRMPSTKTH
jgi:hypothetical protein